MSKWKNYDKKKPKEENSYIVAWKPANYKSDYHNHFYALWNYDFIEGFKITGPATEWNEEIKILAWRKLPNEYKEE